MAEVPSGYDEDFVNPVEDEVLCLICHLPLKEPVQTRCGHRFCKECLEEHFIRQGVQNQPLTCPADRGSLVQDRDVFPDKATERKILSFAIKCPSEGCDWTGELRNKEVHLTSCIFKLVSCTNENCDVTVQRKDLEEHVTITCQWRILECDHCSEPHPKCKMEDHTTQCSKFPVSCPNSCGGSFPNEMIPNHTKDDCPLTIISCPYEQMGCETKVKRKQVESHLQSAMRLHLDLACIKLNDTETKLNDTKKKLEKTTELVEEFNTRMFIWKINNCRKLFRQETKSAPFYAARTESYGYKLRVIISPVVVLFGSNSPSVRISIIVMKGEYDAILPWPIRKKVKFTLIDQQEDPVQRENLTFYFILRNIPRPTQDEYHAKASGWLICYDMLESRRHIVDDTLFLQVEVAP